MKVVQIPINELLPSARNAKKHTPEQIRHIANSIKEFGIKSVAVITGGNEIVCGHGRIKAAMTLGIKEYPCVIADDLTEDQIRAFRIIDNQTALETPFDEDALRIELGGIADIDFSAFALINQESGLFQNLHIIDDGDFTSIEADAESSDVAARISSETEYSPASEDKAEKIKTQTNAILDRLAAEAPELMAKAICVIVPSGRGDFRDCVVITDPKLGDIVAELKRYAEDGLESPCAALLEGLVSYVPDAKDNQ